MHKYEKACWSCGYTDMEKDDHGVRCRKCGVTWNEVPHPGRPSLKDATIYKSEFDCRGEHRGGAPSGSATRRAAQARGDIPPRKT